MNVEHLESNKVIAFGILHYKDEKVTKRCIDSIRLLTAYPQYLAYIVVVDNASGNDSVSKLIKCYSDVDSIRFIESQENLGFAGGNNLAFKYAKEKLNANYFIALNNDTAIQQKDFLTVMVNEFERTSGDILYPDVFDMVRLRHQSPLFLEGELFEYAARQHERDVKRKNSNSGILSNIKFGLKKVVMKIPGLNRLELSRMLKRMRNQASPSATGWEEAQEGAVGIGAAVIFGNSYINRMSYAFYPGTFLYYEECIQKLVCDRNGFKTYYTPALEVLHYHQELNYQSAVKRHDYVYESLFDSYNIFLELRNDESELRYEE